MKFAKLAAAVCLSLLMAISAVNAQRPDSFRDSYQLEEMVILSRHNIRSPLSRSIAALGDITPHKWFKWTSGSSELSLKGGQLETIMGQYFGQLLEREGLIQDRNTCIPTEGEMRFYANSRQRTVATARYFSGGMLPVANATVEHGDDLTKRDPVFSTQLTFVSDAFRAQAMDEISAMGGARGLRGIADKAEKNCRTLEKVLDFKDSPAAKKNGPALFRPDDFGIVLEMNKEPAVKGSLNLANAAGDALILQHYEEQDEADFGHRLTQKEWEEIAEIKNIYDEVLFTPYSVAVNAAHPLLEEIDREISLPGRKFAFLCGHDSNIASVLAALEVEEYELPQSIEKKTPIGSKLVVEKFVGRDGQEYAALSLVYQTTDQIRARTALTLDNPPMGFPLKLKGLQANADGLYSFADLKQRFQKAILAYDDLPNDAESEAA